MSTQYVRNAVVRENYWAVENFFETKKDGFAAASQEYTMDDGSVVLVCFHNRGAYILTDSDTGASITNQDFMNELATLHKDNQLFEDFEELYEDSCTQVGIKGALCDEDTLDAYGFSDEQKQDVMDRMEDLENYYDDIEEDMNG